MSLRNGDWIVAIPDGRFDTNDLEKVEGLHWILSSDPLTPLPLEIFMRDYYEPRLLSRVLNGEAFKPIRKLSELNFKAVLDLLAGRQVDAQTKKRISNADKLRQASPEDLVLISFSSHGYADNDGNFYFILSDTGKGDGEKVTEELVKRLRPRFLSS